jgi:hypothetical protein
MMIGLLIAEYAILVTMPMTWNRVVGFDYQPYIQAASHWLSGGSFYLPYQLAGPYAVFEHEIMYPPTVLLILVPFTVLPPPLWWAIPAIVTAWFVASWRPSRLGWIAILACLAYPWSPVIWLAGNPVIWVVAGIAAAPRFGWPAVVVAIKPQFAPLAVFGLGKRSFWLAAGLVAAVSLLMLPLWFDWLTAMRNVKSWPGGNWAYWLNNVPLLAVPPIAWASRSGESRGAGSGWLGVRPGAGRSALPVPVHDSVPPDSARHSTTPMR